MYLQSHKIGYADKTCFHRSGLAHALLASRQYAVTYVCKIFMSYETLLSCMAYVHYHGGNAEYR